MKKLILLSLLFLLPLQSMGEGIKSVGSSQRGDKREVIGWLSGRPSYVSANTKNMWNTAPYNRIVMVSRSDGGIGTGEFISPRHVLTNAHVAAACGMNGRAKCSIHTADGKKLSAGVKFYGVMDKTQDWDDGKDWQVLEIDGEYCGQNWFEMLKTTTLPQNNVWRAGWGGLRVLNDQDMKNIRAAYSYWLRNGGSGPLRQDISSNREKYKPFLDKFRELSGGHDFIKEYLKDHFTLKARKDCTMAQRNSKMFKHTCDGWPGDSGSTIQNSNNRIVGLNNSGSGYIGYGSGDDSAGLKVENFAQKSEIINAIGGAVRSCENRQQTIQQQAGAVLNGLSHTQQQPQQQTIQQQAGALLNRLSHTK